MTETNGPFDTRAAQHHRARAKCAPHNDALFLIHEVERRLLDRLEDITRKFPCVCSLGPHSERIRTALESREGTVFSLRIDGSRPEHCLTGKQVLVSDDGFLPLADTSLDLLISNFALHWINDLPGLLIQARRVIKPDGLFLAAFPGGETLRELREVLVDAETVLTGGLSPRLSPMVDVRDAGSLLQRAGFALPVVDVDRITVSYPDMFALMRDLRLMGETNALTDRPRGMARRDIFSMAAALYAEKFGDSENRIPATFDILFLTAWTPDDSQQKPMQPGSATTSLADFLTEKT